MQRRTGDFHKGRGSQITPPNRFEPVHYEERLEDFDGDEEALGELQDCRTQYLPDSSKSIVSENDSPDVGFRYSLNPYRGCEHGCPYCYARPTHEYLGLSAGLDFESTIYVKERAPELFRDWLARESWEPETIAFSGVTDCYQPAERRFRLTRRCLRIALEARQPVAIVTKNALVLRDLDLLRQMAALNVVSVSVSITTLDASLARAMEPRTSPPESRLRAIRELGAAGVPVRVMVAPVIPGLNDSEIPAVLEAARDAGARAAAYVLLRLPLTVEPVFREWLHRTQPLKARKIEGLIRRTRGGRFNSSRWGERMVGRGQTAEQIRNLFRVFARRYGLDDGLPPHDCRRFRRPTPRSGQLRLF